MRRKYSASSLLGAAFALIFSAFPSQADRLPRFSDDYHGYHLRTPYYHAGAGFHHPRHGGPALYYGYHYDHAPAYPVPIYRTDRPVVVHQSTIVYRAKIVYGEGPAGHFEWCQARYRSYRASDNTFQPFHGARRQCWSPYS